MKCLSKQVGTARVRVHGSDFPGGWGIRTIKAVVWSSVLIPGWDVLREQGHAILPDISRNEELSIYTIGYVKPIFELMIQCQCELKCTD